VLFARYYRQSQISIIALLRMAHTTLRKDNKKFTYE